MTEYPFSFEAAILEKNHQPLTVGEVTFDGPLLPGQVLVRVLYSGICGKQIEEIEASAGPDPYLPHMLGHEGSAVVMEPGPGVTKVAKGDHVVLHWMKGSGIEAATPLYWRGDQRINAGLVTTFNRHAVIGENRMTPVPKGSDMRLACLLGCAVSTGIGVTFNEAKLDAGCSLAVIGCGGVGLNVIQGAALRKAHPIIAVDTEPAALERAREFGASHVVLAGGGGADVPDQIRGLTEGEGAECVIVTATSPAAIEAGAASSTIPGRVYVLGVPPAGSKVTFDAKALHLKRMIMGAIGGGIFPDRDIPGYLKLYESGRLKLEELVVDEIPLSDINLGIDRMREGRTHGRVVVYLGVS